MQVGFQQNPSDNLEEMQHMLSFFNNYSVNEIDSHTIMVRSKKPGFQQIGGKSYLIKNMEVPQEDHQNINNILDTLSLHQELSNKYLLTLLHHELRTTLTLNNNQNPMYGSNTMHTHKSIQAVYEYGELSLKQEIQTRLATTTFFEQDQLWAILATIVKALGHLQERGIVYGVLNTDKIFINPSNHTVKLLDPSATATDPLMISQGRLYSPEILNDQQQIDMFKSDMFVTGLIILQCGLLVDLSQQIQPDLTNYMNMFKNGHELSQCGYSQSLYHMIESMLETDPQKRPTFQEVRDYLIRELDMNCTDQNRSPEDNIVFPMQNDIQNSCDTVHIMQGEHKKPQKEGNSSNNFKHFYQPQYEQEQVNDILYESYCCDSSMNMSITYERQQQNSRNNKNTKKSAKTNKMKILSQLEKARLKYLFTCSTEQNDEHKLSSVCLEDDNDESMCTQQFQDEEAIQHPPHHIINNGYNNKRREAPNKQNLNLKNTKYSNYNNQMNNIATRKNSYKHENNHQKQQKHAQNPNMSVKNKNSKNKNNNKQNCLQNNKKDMKQKAKSINKIQIHDNSNNSNSHWSHITNIMNNNSMVKTIVKPHLGNNHGNMNKYSSKYTNNSYIEEEQFQEDSQPVSQKYNGEDTIVSQEPNIDHLHYLEQQEQQEQYRPVSHNEKQTYIDTYNQRDSRKRTKQIKDKLVKNNIEQPNPHYYYNSDSYSHNSSFCSNNPHNSSQNTSINQVKQEVTTKYVDNNKQLFTDPQLMKIIKEDLARISTSKYK